MDKANLKMSGQGILEYAVILVLVAMLVVFVLVVLGDGLNNVYQNIIRGIPG